MEWSVGRLLGWAAGYLAAKGVEAPRLSAELLLAKVLGCDRLGVYLRHDQPLEEPELKAFKVLLLRRASHEPVAYITGTKEFYSLELEVGPGVLIPRPETEIVVDAALEMLEGYHQPLVLDMCTGCGAIALAIAANHPGARVVGVDISAKALGYARANARRLGLEGRVQWLQGNVWAPLAGKGMWFDLIVANPPYVAEGDWHALPPQVREYEPREALVAGEGGLDVIKEIVEGARAFLRPLAAVVMEIDPRQWQAVRELARAARIFPEVELRRDLAGAGRVVVMRRGDYG